MTVQTPLEFAEKIGESLAVKAEDVDGLFNIEEDKQGYFVATLYPKKFLNKEQFRMMCGLVKDLGGEGYLQGAKAWRVPGPLAKKSPTPTPTETPTQTPSAREISQSSQLVISTLAEDEDIKGLRGSSKKIGRLYPVLVDPAGNVIDGFHRLKADPDWPKFMVDGITDPLQLARGRLIANERRNVSPEEKGRLLREIYAYTKWTAKQMGEDLGWDISTVYKYLPDDLKDRIKAAAGALGGSDSALRRRADDGKPVSNETVKTQDTTVPIETPKPQDTREETPPSEEKSEKEEPKEISDSHFGEEKQGWARPGEAVQIAEFDCPDCHQHLIVEHQASRKHVIRIVREVE
jgi:ParB-like chromosome segregation protein Spo0J